MDTQQQSQADSSPHEQPSEQHHPPQNQQQCPSPPPETQERSQEGEGSAGGMQCFQGRRPAQGPQQPPKHQPYQHKYPPKKNNQPYQKYPQPTQQNYPRAMPVPPKYPHPQYFQPPHYYQQQPQYPQPYYQQQPQYMPYPQQAHMQHKMQNLQSIQNMQNVQNMQNMQNINSMQNIQNMQNMQKQQNMAKVANIQNLSNIANMQSMHNLGGAGSMPHRQMTPPLHTLPQAAPQRPIIIAPVKQKQEDSQSSFSQQVQHLAQMPFMEEGEEKGREGGQVETDQYEDQLLFQQLFSLNRQATEEQAGENMQFNELNKVLDSQVKELIEKKKYVKELKKITKNLYPQEMEHHHFPIFMFFIYKITILQSSDRVWFYQGSNNQVQGPFSSLQMDLWNMDQQFDNKLVVYWMQKVVGLSLGAFYQNPLQLIKLSFLQNYQQVKSIFQQTITKKMLKLSNQKFIKKLRINQLKSSTDSSDMQKNSSNAQSSLSNINVSGINNSAYCPPPQPLSQFHPQNQPSSFQYQQPPPEQFLPNDPSTSSHNKKKAPKAKKRHDAWQQPPQQFFPQGYNNAPQAPPINYYPQNFYDQPQEQQYPPVMEGHPEDNQLFRYHP